MGDSSVSCAFSGITLYNEPVVFLPLFRGRRHEKLAGSRLIGWDSQACSLFSPMTLPYRGKLDCYGRLESVEKDENTASIETVGMSIEDFTQACVDGGDLVRNDEKISGAGCFIHPAVYERFSKPVTGGKYADSLWQSVFAGKPHLEEIGCKLVHDIGGGKRYRYVYQHPSISGVSFHTDGEFTHVFDDSTGTQLYGYSLQEMQSSLRESRFPLFPSSDVAKARSIRALPRVIKIKIEQALEQIRWRYEEPYDRVTINSLIPLITYVPNMEYLFHGTHDELRSKYIEAFLQDRLLDEAADLRYVLDAFSLYNRALMPTIVGTQYPVHSATYAITSFVTDLAKRRNKESA